MKAVILALAMGAASAACPNMCSGHGTCGSDDACTCYPDFIMGDEDGGDCSDRKCPFETAWVTTPDASGYVHSYAECAGRGICDRSSGECECFDGYTGKGCGYTTCPNDCSGHGTCEYVSELTYGSVPGDYYDAVYQGMKTESLVLSYVDTLWDAKKSRACVCDPMYTDVDCSRKMCPKGNDVMDTRLDTGDDLVYQVQNITMYAGQGSSGFDWQTAAVDESMKTLANDTFALTFKSTLNETYTTIPIVLNVNVGNPHMAADIEAALEGLPNYVIDAVSVNVTSEQLPAGTANNMDIETVRITVAFIGATVQGPQNLLMVETKQCLDGCTPKITGVDLESGSYSTSRMSFVTESRAADYNNYECGRRGKCDYDTGVCECFEGYTGLQCQIQTSLA